MRVEIRFQLSNVPLIFNEVTSTYQKGSFYCLRIKKGVTKKYPIDSIFEVTEIE